MFNDDELEGCPSIAMEEWLQKNEVRIREMATRPYNTEWLIIRLLIDCWDAKKCPYA